MMTQLPVPHDLEIGGEKLKSYGREKENYSDMNGSWGHWPRGGTR